MKALVKDKPEKGLTYKNIPTPQVSDTDVLLKVKAAAICGTDTNAYAWNDWAKNTYKNLPFVLGHECAGEVVEIGAHVNRISVGDRVAAETHVPCGDCYHCFNGMQHICPSMKVLGAHMDGCFAEYVVIPEVCARKLPDTISYEEGSLLEPMGVAMRPVWEGNVPGETVLVIGCGPIGQLAISLAKAMGCHHLFACDVNEYRLNLAKEAGADVIINPTKQNPIEVVADMTDGLGIGVSIELSGSDQGIKTAFEILRKGGNVFISGQPKGPVELDLGRDVLTKEARVRGFHGREMYQTWELAESFVTTKKIDLLRVVTHRFGMDNCDEAFRIVKEGDGLKVLFLPEGVE